MPRVILTADDVERLKASVGYFRSLSEPALALSDAGRLLSLAEDMLTRADGDFPVDDGLEEAFEEITRSAGV